ncbi:hypothetical protein [Niabella beijingensis]|uniref:hypothetical protein n=1 Tax=Niabella beijingensis TaxID=2872700 RepID=UPI001CBDCC84|nr:hypothetical protein [Niabella beijingensis]MBZ4192235.1 hypothetical protein [Niabella beijingensis]
MKKIFVLAAVFYSSSAFSQSQTDFFCSGRTYHLTSEKNALGKFTVKLFGFSSQTIVIDSSKLSWDKLSQSKKDSLVIAKLKEKNVIISQSSILENSKFEDEAKSATVDFIDTLSYNQLAEVNSPALSRELEDAFKNRFSVSDCKYDFDLLLERLTSKSAVTAAESKSIVDVLENSFGVGIGLGPNFNMKKTYDYYVSPYDTTLKRERLNNPSFVASLLLTWNPLYSYRKFQEGDSTVATGEKFRAPGYWGIAIGFNFAEVNPSGMQFNFRLSGGIGLLGNLGGGFQVGLFYDLTQQKVLRSDMEQYIDKKYPFSDISNLDSRLFTTQFIPSVSFKCIYKFKGNTAERRGLLTN